MYNFRLPLYCLYFVCFFTCVANILCSCCCMLSAENVRYLSTPCKIACATLLFVTDAMFDYVSLRFTRFLCSAFLCVPLGLFYFFRVFLSIYVFSCFHSIWSCASDMYLIKRWWWWWWYVDVLEVNGLTVDWISSHIYWTDGRKRSVEVAEFDGTNRRILITERLSQPRGVYADPVNGFVSISSPSFWIDGLNNCFV